MLLQLRQRGINTTGSRMRQAADDLDETRKKMLVPRAVPQAMADHYRSTHLVLKQMEMVYITL